LQAPDKQWPPDWLCRFSHSISSLPVPHLTRLQCSDPNSTIPTSIREAIVVFKYPENNREVRYWLSNIVGQYFTGKKSSPMIPEMAVHRLGSRSVHYPITCYVLRYYIIYCPMNELSTRWWQLQCSLYIGYS
jgi:hypothetical protein